MVSNTQRRKITDRSIVLPSKELEICPAYINIEDFKVKGEGFMENSLKAIIIGAGVVITLIVVSIGFLLMRSGQDTAQNAINQLGGINKEMSESQYTNYDGLEVRGSEVVNVLKRFKDEYIGIQVITKKDTAGTWYIHELDANGNIDSTLSTPNISIAMDESGKQYINPNGIFIGSLLRDDNDTITALIFTQQ